MTTIIRETRERLGLDRGEFARAANLNQAQISRLETGSDKAGPSIRGRVSEALQQPTEALFDADGWPLPSES